MFPQTRRYLGEAAITEPPQAATAFDQAMQEIGPSEEAGYYTFEHDLLANGNQPALGRSIDGDSDFILLSVHGKSTGAFKMNIRDHAGRPIYSSATDADLVIGTAQLPVKLKAPLFFPAAGAIGIELIDISGAPNPVKLVFGGIRKFRTR